MKDICLLNAIIISQLNSMHLFEPSHPEHESKLNYFVFSLNYKRSSLEWHNQIEKGRH